jgi:hypothetical protein
VRSITELLVRTADLAEAEGRLFRAATIRVAGAVTVIGVAGAAIAAGVILVLAALFIVTADRGGPALAALVTGAVALGLGGALAWLGRRMGV